MECSSMRLLRDSLLKLGQRLNLETAPILQNWRAIRSTDTAGCGEYAARTEYEQDKMGEPHYKFKMKII
jgi:hypothetical protein